MVPYQTWKLRIGYIIQHRLIQYFLQLKGQSYPSTLGAEQEEVLFLASVS